ncbi:S8 family serine peptidase [Lentilactobacillus raoultii]|uniref:S8 family serine peptidase n=1 Tax=Lentilactobacillus raoultii TaxID=1987503 RepID=A0ABW3PI22_9LACO|nr:S8 family serine peptidase [Lentilactobacillus raoultii]
MQTESRKHPIWLKVALISLLMGLNLLFGTIMINTPSAIVPTALAKIQPNANQAAITKGNVSGLWHQGYRGQGMVVAVIDTGIQPHRDLRLSDPSSAKLSKSDAQQLIAKKGYGRYVNAKIPFAYNYVTNSSRDTAPDNVSTYHGEHVSGIIAANGQPTTKKSNEYVIGVAPEAQLLDLKVSDMINDETKNDVARAIYDAVDLGANVISISLGVGLPNQSMTDEEQAAVQYAINHGVFVSLAGGNSGHSASIFTSNPLADTNSINTAFEPANSGTLADPSVAVNAMTVGAENSLQGKKSDEAGFSSWGPTPNFALKPDISAPGMGITSTWANNTYQVQEGTSMATPYVSGAAALLLQKIHQDQPNLTGAGQVAAVKNALMNGASPLRDPNDKKAKVPVSPRRQGAGQINVTRSANLNASAVDPTTNLASVSLGQIGSTKHFRINITNHGTSPMTYSVNDNGGPMTEVRDKKQAGQVHDAFLKGSSVVSNYSRITVQPGESQTLDFQLTLADSVAPQRMVEGYLTFKADQADQSLVVPYMGYYGDATKERIVDAPAYQRGSAFKGGYLIDEHNTPLGISDQASLNQYVNAHADRISWKQLVKSIHPSLVAFSPNDDHHQDLVEPLVYVKQSLAGVKAQIVNQAGRVVRVIDQETNLDKSIAGDDDNLDLTTSYSMRQHPNALEWDGRYDDVATGQSRVVPNGRYHYQLITTNYNDGIQKKQTVSYPVMVDTISPKAFHLVYAGKSGRLTGRFSDRGAGFTKISRAALEINRRQYAVPVTAKAAKTGHFSDHLNSAARTALRRHSAKLKLTDIAGNSATFAVRRHQAATASAKPTTETRQAMPQFKWYRYGTSQTGFSSSYIDIRDRTFKLLARVPKHVTGLTAYAKNTLTNRVTKGHVNSAKGIASFKFKFDSSGSIVLSGWSQVPGSQVGTYLKSASAETSLGRFPSSPAFAKLKKLAPKLATNRQAKKLVTISKGAPQIYGHRQKDLTDRAAATPGIKFSQLKDNGPSWLNAKTSASIYNPQSQELTINGQVKNPKRQQLTILVTPDDQAAINQVPLSATGHFSVQVPFKPTEQRGVGYILTTKVKEKHRVKYQRHRGVLEIYLDTVAPTLTVQKTVAANKVTFTGSANDNVSGVRLLINGSNLLTQQNDAGLNQHVAGQPLNPYPAESFKKTYSLKPGPNHFKVEAVDQVGNVTTSLYTING